MRAYSRDMRWVLVVALLIGFSLSLSGSGCGDDGPVAVIDAGGGPDGNFASEGEVCGDAPGDLDAGALPCATGLVCCYPCGIPDCNDVCMTPCTDGPGCVDGCPLVP